MLTSHQLEGLFTILVSIFYLVFFPKDPSDPVSFLGYRMFSPRERDILVRRIQFDDPTKQKKHNIITLKELTTAVCTSANEFCIMF
jgi:hypothetical protein